MTRSWFVVAVLVTGVLATSVLAKGIQDPFGTRVVSFQTVPVEGLNSALASARGERLAWTEDPVLLAMHLLPGAIDTSGERSSFRAAFEMDARTTPPTGVVTLVEDGLQDDSLGAIWHQVLLQRGADQRWVVTGHRQAQRCRRGGNTRDFRAELCP